MKTKSDCSLGIVCSPKNGDYLINLLKSVSMCNTAPAKVMIFFNEFTEDLIPALNFSIDFGADTFVYQEIQPLARLWNQTILFTRDQKHSLVFNEDIIIKDPDLFENVSIYHQQNPLIVKYCEAMSAFSVTKDLIKEVGWFDENYLWCWEDCDYRMRMCQKDIKPLHVMPEPVIHMRALGGNGHNIHKDRWNLGMDFFYKKWNINKCIQDNGLPFVLDENSYESKRSMLLNGLFCDYFYDNFAKNVEQRIDTKNYYTI